MRTILKNYLAVKAAHCHCNNSIAVDEHSELVAFVAVTHNSSVIAVGLGHNNTAVVVVADLDIVGFGNSPVAGAVAVHNNPIVVVAVDCNSIVAVVVGKNNHSAEVAAGKNFAVVQMVVALNSVKQN